MDTGTTEQSARGRGPRWRPLLAAAAIAGVALALAACGGSASSNSTSTSKAAASSQSGSRSGRFTALRECLAKEGITLPSRPSGATPPSGAAPGPRGGFKLPEGVSQAKFQEALKKCGGGLPGGGRRNANPAAFQRALTKYAACVRENGVNLPAPNTSGNGPVFNTKGLNTSSAAFKSAQQKCKADLPAAFGSGGRPPGGATGAPPSGAEGGPPAGTPPGGGGPGEAGA